ncbi:non-ribosomal peptide synthetase [Streptomyces sp. NPDC018045]|uniref:non-ribosomal peptide synthetase n=1 Tax=Streptomyces sp. NPDC018045 TaxID=3365037 RepID=UPI003792A99E
MTAKTAQGTVPQLVEDRVARGPGTVAVIVGDPSGGSVRVTYRELWDAAGTVAARLTALPGFAPGALVATAFPRGVQNIAAQLGAWRAGAAYLPLDVTQPRARRETILHDARPLAVLSPDGDAPDAVTADLTGETVDAEAGDGTAYVIYTSGSTGTPKGVEVGHAALGNLVRWHTRTYGTGPGVRVGAFAGLGFDASAWEVWSALAGGATLVLPDGLATTDTEALGRFMDRWSVRQCFLSTPLAERMFAAPRPPRTLRILTTGGDRLRVRPPADFPAAVFNHYGPTEATVVTTAGGDLRQRPDAPENGGAPTIGRPVPGAEVRLVAEDGTVVTAPGVPGELLIGGEVLAFGYRHDAALTRKLFVHRPDGGRWYSSGDICRWTADGELEFAGRRDGQLSLRGHRVEPAEVERAALRVTGVDQAAVVLRPDEDGGELWGFHAGTASESELRDALAEALPEYLRPAVLRRLEALPLNANGKLDRAALQALLPPAPAPGGEPDGGPAGDSVTDRVAEIWREVLGRTPAPADNFFQIGGHSLKAARVLATTRKAFGITLPFEVMFASPVFADFAERVAEQVRAEGE